MIDQAMIVLLLLIFLGVAFCSRNSTRIQMEGEPNSIGTLQLISTLLATAVGGGLILGITEIGMQGGVIGAILGFVVNDR